MIKLGVSACFMYKDIQRQVFGHKTLSYVENDMYCFLAQKGVMPILIPDVEDSLQKQYLNEIDGLVLQGGVDVSPKSYGEEGIENNRWPGDYYRDQYELKLVDWAFKNNKPILGICRGMQILNVYFGGTLYQDLEIQTKTHIRHRCANEYDKIQHGVELASDSFLKEAYQADKIEVNTVHHQGVKDLGKNLIVEATSHEDNLIEAFRHKDKPVWGVQWHPEFNLTLKGKIPPAKPIMDKFLEMIKETKTKESEI